MNHVFVWTLDDFVGLFILAVIIVWAIISSVFDQFNTPRKKK